MYQKLEALPKKKKKWKAAMNQPHCAIAIGKFEYEIIPHLSKILKPNSKNKVLSD